MTTQEIEAHISTLWSHLQDIAESDVSIETKIDLIKEINHWNEKLTSGKSFPSPPLDNNE